MRGDFVPVAPASVPCHCERSVAIQQKGANAPVGQVSVPASSIENYLP